MPNLRISSLLSVALLAMASFATASPLVTMSMTPDIGGSGFQAIDFYYASSAAAEFTNYRLNFETTNGAYIYDPSPTQRQASGSAPVDTYMNTVGSSLGLSDASHIQSTY